MFRQGRFSLVFWITVGLLTVCFLFARTSPDDQPRHYTFTKAKKKMDQIYDGNLMETLYCGCKYTSNHNPNGIDFAPCGFQPRKNEKRANRIEWEHVVTAHNMGKARQCWHKVGKKSARKNCTDTDSAFGIMEGDLHNLMPSIGEVNGDRSNYMYSQWTNSPEPMYGTCQTIIDFKNRKVQPRPESRGIIARISFYMEKEYGIILSAKSRRLLEIWDKEHPVTSRECIRDERIAKVQGNHNPFVASHCSDKSPIQKKE